MFVMLGIISFLGINSVSAKTVEATNFYDNFYNLELVYNIHKSKINEMIELWKQNYSSTYPFYYVVLDYNLLSTQSSACSNDPTKCNINLYYSNSNSISRRGYNNSYTSIGSPYKCSSGTLNCSDVTNLHYLHISYNPTNDTFSDYNSSTSYSDIPYNNPSFFHSNNESHIFLSTLTSNGFIYSSSDSPTNSDITTISLPAYTDDNLNIAPFSINNGDSLPDYLSLSSGNYTPTIPDNYIEIDLNKYPYVILSLKDYKPRDTFTSTMYVKGQLCPTTLYNYGMEEKKDYVSGYQTQPCSYYYNNFTPFTSYIKSEDIKNHAVYYLTSYDNSKPNLVKVDTSVYDITYITSENKDDPYVSIGGKNYPALSYDSLTDSSTLTEKNGISNEWTCAKYDTDCLINSSGMDINDLFDKPLEFLKGLWSSITSIFEVITEFLSLLPETMQSFLYLSFMVAIVLGLLKLIL